MRTAGTVLYLVGIGLICLLGLCLIGAVVFLDDLEVVTRLTTGIIVAVIAFGVTAFMGAIIMFFEDMELKNGNAD